MAEKVRSEYLKYMEQKMVYFETQSNRLFGRNIRQILLLHSNFLNAEVLGQLIDIYRKHGYRFVSIDNALKDKVYDSEISVFKNWGISWLDRWALSQKVPRDFFKDEPQTPTFINDY